MDKPNLTKIIEQLTEEADRAPYECDADSWYRALHYAIAVIENCIEQKTPL